MTVTFNSRIVKNFSLTPGGGQDQPQPSTSSIVDIVQSHEAEAKIEAKIDDGEVIKNLDKNVDNSDQEDIDISAEDLDSIEVKSFHLKRTNLQSDNIEGEEIVPKPKKRKTAAWKFHVIDE